MTALEFLVQWHKRFPFHSVEKPHILASNSEIRRWFNNKAVLINGEQAKWDDDMEQYEFEEIILDCKLEGDKLVCKKSIKSFMCESLVLFPKGERRTTLW